jgi:mannose-6-phosphate isomerase
MTSGTVTSLDLAVAARATRAPAWPRVMLNSIRRYDWGSRSVLAHLQGRAECDHPEAELWMGAHPMAPSVLLDADGFHVSLVEAIKSDPVRVLGAPCARRFGTRLPFLLKVLAVEKALSVQVHPSPEQARAGYEREEAAGIPLTSPDRVYVDPYAKPELLYAVTGVEALAGLRPAREAGFLVDLLDAPRLARVRRHLGGAGDVVGALTVVVDWPRRDRADLVAEVAAGARGALEEGRGRLDDDARAALGWVLALARQHPGDPLVLGPLLLQLHRLEPGGSLFVPAGVAHAYLSGVGVEIMASSDNVVRAGLTHKHVEADAVLHLLDPQAHPVVGNGAIPLGPDESAFRPPVEEFQLTRVRVGREVPGGPALVGTVPLATEVGGAQVLLCLTGEVEVSTGAHRVLLRGGQSAFLGADAPPVALTGVGEVFRAAAGHLAP